MIGNKRSCLLFLIGIICVMLFQISCVGLICGKISGGFENIMIALCVILHAAFSVFAGIRSYQYTKMIILPALEFAVINVVDFIYICAVLAPMLDKCFPSEGDFGVMAIILILLGSAIASTPLFLITSLFTKLEHRR